MALQIFTPLAQEFQQALTQALNNLLPNIFDQLEVPLAATAGIWVILGAAALMYSAYPWEAYAANTIRGALVIQLMSYGAYSRWVVQTFTVDVPNLINATRAIGER